MNCSVEDCGRASKSRGMCQLHYRRWWKHGDPLHLDRPASYAGQGCSAAGCAERPYVDGLCSKHFQRQKANGDPLAIRRREKGTGSINAQGYMIITVPGHPLANARGTLEHRVVLYDAIGPLWHPCHWCGAMVTWDITTPADPHALVVDHVDFDKLNNDRANLVPSCWGCNIARTRASAGVY